MSGHSFSNSDETLKKYNLSGFIKKPFVIDNIINLLEKISKNKVNSD